MAKFKGKWDIRSYQELTGSSDLNARRKFKQKQRIPFELQRGKKSKFFKKKFVDNDLIALPIVNLDDKFHFVPLRKVQYRSMLDEQVSASLQEINAPAALLTTISASLNTQIANLPDVIILLGEDEAEGVMTGSYFIAQSGSSAVAYSGIANSSGYMTWQFNNNSQFNTGATWSFAVSGGLNSGPTASGVTNVDGVFGNELHQLEHTGSFFIRTFASGSHTASFVEKANPNVPGSPQLTSNPTQPISASRIDLGNFIYYSSSLGKSTAGFNRTIIDANIFGDGDESTFAAQFGQPTASLYAASRELITFPYDTVVASGTFDHSQNFLDLALGGNRAATPRPAKVVTLFWASGSGGTTSSNGLSGSISPSNTFPDTDSIAGASSGSHIFLDAALTQPASGGYYSTNAIGGTENTVTGHTIHVAGDGILGFTQSGSSYFVEFSSAHESSASLLTVAPRWNGMSFTKS